MKPGTKWTDDEHRRLAELVAEGRTVKEIALALDRIPAVVNRKKSMLGLVTRQADCQLCGRPLAQTWRGRPRQYCSDDCRKNERIEATRLLRAARRNVELAARTDWTCEVCSIEMPRTNATRKYCSRVCGAHAWYLRAKAAGDLPYQQRRAAKERRERDEVAREGPARSRSAQRRVAIQREGR